MNLSYTVIVFDENNDRVATIENATQPTYNRAKNSADQVQFQVPRRDPKSSELLIGRRFEIIRGAVSNFPERLEVSGVIQERGFTGEVFNVTGFTEEIVLERRLTPAQYGYPIYSQFANVNEFFDFLQYGYSVERVKRNWTDFIINEANVDYSSQPDILLLDNYSNADNENPASGIVTFRFTKESGELWDRIRWVSDHAPDEVGISSSVSWVLRDSGGSVIDTNAPEVGALTDVVGLVVTNVAGGDTLDVTVNLSTLNSEASPVLFAFEVIKKEPVAGIDSVVYENDATTVKMPSIEANNKSLLQVVIDVCDAIGWEFELQRGVLEFREKFGSDRKNDFTLVQS